MRVPPLAVLAAVSLTSSATAQTFVNWESPHVNPIALTPDGTRLLAVNTADNRLEVFTVSGTTLGHVASIPVGLDPVSVAARTDTEAWVVNHVSDTISVVDLGTLNVRATIRTGDEPTDVVFAAGKAFVSVSQLNEVRVFDPSALNASPTVIPIAGEDPRALATDGTTVFVAIFESGNDTSILGEATVTDGAVNPYPGDPNPVPNDGLAFDPPIAGGLPAPPGVGHIIQKQPGGAWEDANGFDWSPAVTWDMHDHDVAMIDAASLGVSYRTGIQNLNMYLAVRPGGNVVVVGTEALNHVRFEPNHNGTFLRVQAVEFAPGGGAATIVDLNPHLNYATPSVPQNVRDQSIGDPRGIAFNAAGDRAWITGMGSNNVILVDGALNRIGRVEVGEGPTGVLLNETAGVLYTLNKFDGSISIVDTTAMSESERIEYYDPTPGVISAGRPHLYDTHETSGLGHVSCGSCHIDGRMDQLAWDLGDPGGSLTPLDQGLCNLGLPIPGCESNFHPMKGPMTTQTLVDITDTGILHWRGDRGTFADFNPAFESLLGDDEQRAPAEMDEFAAFVDTLTTPPNPFRNLNGTLANADLPGTGNPFAGEGLFMTGNLDLVNCVTCHALPSGTNGTITSGNLLQETQSIKIPQLRNAHEKTGFSFTSQSNNRGFGYIHDGSVPTLLDFFQFSGFNFISDAQRQDVVAFMLSFSVETHAGVGAQDTIGDNVADASLRDALKGIAESSAEVGLIAKGVVAGEPRGYYYVGANVFQSDRSAETATLAQLDSGVGPGAEMTYTLVPRGDLDAILVRLGVDRDGDSHFDRDEIDACKDPADPASFPGDGQPTICDCLADLDGSGDVGFADILEIIGAWGPCVGCPQDLSGNGAVDFADILQVIAAWGPCI